MQSNSLVPYTAHSPARTWLSRLLALRLTTEPRSPDAPRVPYVGRTTAGVVVTPDNAITLPAVWSAIRYVSQTTATPPWHVMRTTPNGGERADKHPLDYVLCKRPNPEWSSFQFRETLTHWALRWGNGYAEIERDTSYRPVALWPIHPERVTVKRDPETQALYYEVNNGTAALTYIDAADMFHIRGFGEGPVGVNVMQYAAESLGWAKAAQLFGSAFFGKGANPSAVVTMKRPLSGPALEDLTKRFRGLYAGPKSERTVFLDNEMDFKQLTIAPENAQFIETNKWLVVEIARWFGVPPHKIASLDNATYSNIEHQAIEAVQDSITPWILRFEAEANFKLGLDQRGYYTKMNLNALLRGDAASRAQFYTNMRQNGAFTVNDILRLEDLPTVDPKIGEVRVMQSQFVPIEKLGETKAPAAPALTPAEPDDDDDGEDERVELEMRGEITASSCDRLLKAIDKVNPRAEIVLRITTPGGSADDATEIAEKLLAHKGRVRVIGESQVDSAGVIVFLAGDREARLCTADCTFLVHATSFERPPSYWTKEFKRGAESAYADQVAKLFGRRTGKSWFKFRSMMNSKEGETLTALRAADLGIVSDILPARVRAWRSSKKRKAK
jgi:HK97 family phage portal protein